VALIWPKAEKGSKNDNPVIKKGKHFLQNLLFMILILPLNSQSLNFPPRNLSLLYLVPPLF
jgi:hypothetical protein